MAGASDEILHGCNPIIRHNQEGLMVFEACDSTHHWPTVPPTAPSLYQIKGFGSILLKSVSLAIKWLVPNK
jgi:hypothetical protein